MSEGGCEECVHKASKKKITFGDRNVHPASNPMDALSLSQQRNWRWFVPLGCVSLLALLALLVILIVIVAKFVLKLRLDQWL